MNNSFNRVAILGLGLIGSSIARALSEKKLIAHIAAYDSSVEALKYALSQGFIQSSSQKASDAVNDADLIIFAAPVEAFADLAKDISSSIKQGAIVTDVASVKQLAVEAIKPHLPEYVFYVPAHPIAGSEKTGVEAGSSQLFAGKRVILTPEEADLLTDVVTGMRILWERIGAKVDFMPAELHDLIYAYVSHLPQIIAYAAAPVVATHRLTKSDAKLWAGICLANKECVTEALDDFIMFLTQMHGELLEHKQEEEGKADVAQLFSGLIATCLIATASLLEEKIQANPVQFAGAGFSDMTVTPMKDPQELLAAISSHSKQITPLLQTTLERLRQISVALDAENKEELIRLFSVA